MLAYVVWHHPDQVTDLSRYEEVLIQFHQIMEQNKPSGYTSSNIFRIPNVPWMSTNNEILFDWYFIENASALDALNQSIYTSNIQAAHEEVAIRTMGGVTALYQPKLGVENIHQAKYISWLSKPKGLKYNEFYNELHFINEDQHASLWMRYLGLGPGPEFCLVSSIEFNFDDRYEPLVKPATHIFSSRAKTGI